MKERIINEIIMVKGGFVSDTIDSGGEASRDSRTTLEKAESPTGKN